MRINLGSVRSFERRFVLAALLAGLSELLLGLSPYGALLNGRLSMFGYLGVGMVLLSFWHFVLIKIDDRRSE